MDDDGALLALTAVARDVAALMFAVVWLATIDLQPLTVGVTPRW